jgi:hypothetical protein
MSDNIPIWADVAQVVSLPVAILALLLQIVAYFYPSPPRTLIAQTISKIRPFLPYVFIAAVFFWLGATLFNSQPPTTSSQDSVQGTIVALESTNTAQQHEIATANARITEVTPLSQSETASPATTPAQSSATAVPGNTSTPPPPVSEKARAAAEEEYDKYIKNWTVIYTEKFEDETARRLNWSNITEPGVTDIINEQFVIDVQSNGDDKRAFSVNKNERVATILKDTFLVVMQVVRANSCDYGITFSGQPDGAGYFFYISRSNQNNQTVRYGVKRYENGQFNEESPTELIQDENKELKLLQVPPPGIMAVLANGANYKLFVDGHYVDEFTDMKDSNKIGIGVVCQGLTKGSFAFDNFIVQVP